MLATLNRGTTRHLNSYYVFDEKEKQLFYDFVINFHERWRSKQRDQDNDILLFSDSRQQNSVDIQSRDMIIRQAFFEYMANRNHQMLTKDERRAFNEAERIRIYRRDGGLCQMCYLDEGKPEREARVSWLEYNADHVIPHSKGGQTTLENAQVLCQYHNLNKGAARQRPRLSNISYPLPIRGRLQEEAFEAELLDANGHVAYEGKIFKSPSGVGEFVTGWQSCNGWTFWSYYRQETSEWRMIDELRDQQK